MHVGNAGGATGNGKNGMDIPSPNGNVGVMYLYKKEKRMSNT